MGDISSLGVQVGPDAETMLQNSKCFMFGKIN